jgi:hypothetical protein
MRRNRIQKKHGVVNNAISSSQFTKQPKIPISKRKSNVFLLMLLLFVLVICVSIQTVVDSDILYYRHGQTGDSLDSNSNTGKTTTANVNHQWPSEAVEGVGYPLVKKGTNFVDNMHDILFKPNKQNKILMNEFIQVYKNRPDKVNICGIRFNHALALFVSVKVLNPRTVIESGVNAGQSTYFLRKAKKDMEIIALDPEENPICGEQKRWIDTSGKTKYYLGKDFKDIIDFDLVAMGQNGTITPSRTLAFLDDHQEVIQRLPVLMKAGISHLVVEDNYKRGEGATLMDRDGQTPKQLFAFRRRKDNGTLRDADWLFNNVISYREFPPLVPPIMSKKYRGERKPEGGFMFHTDTNTDIVPPLLRSDLNEEDLNTYTKIVSVLGYDPELKDHNSYMQFMNYNQICYLELLPMAWRIVDKW